MNLVGISNSKPKGIEWINHIRSYPPLCPGWKLVSKTKQGLITQDRYVELYYEQVLNKLDPSKVYADLGEDAILLCWEKPGRFCHRTIVAQWFYEHLEIKVNEL